jgi:hypothetical protein
VRAGNTVEDQLVDFELDVQRHPAVSRSVSGFSNLTYSLLAA